MRQDRARTEINRARAAALKKALKSTKNTPTPENMSTAFSLLDKAAKNGLIHKNKAGRQKAALAKLVVTKPLAKTTATKKTAKTKKKSAR